MEKIEEFVDYGVGRDLATKLNEVIRVVNNLKYTEKEEPIYETLSTNEVLIISKNKEGVLVACNRLGVVQLERVKYPREE